MLHYTNPSALDFPAADNEALLFISARDAEYLAC